MNKKILTAMIVLGIMLLGLVGVVSADLLPFFGKITGSATVSAPVFYATGNNIDERIELKELGINNFDSNASPTWFQNGDYRGFATGPLELTHFYDADYNFEFEAKTNNASQKLEVRLFSYNAEDKTNNPYEEEICREIVNITSEEYSPYEFTCSPGIISLKESSGLYWEFKGWNTNEKIKFYIDLREGKTKFTITPTE